MKTSHKRTISQGAFTILTNGYLKGFLDGTIFKGFTKRLCVPGLNCYSCPGALGACPIGALQAVLGGVKSYFSYYVIGFMALYGVSLGRFICGWLCPFGWIQDLLHKIPTKKIKEIPAFLLKIKYFVLALVFLLPILLVNDYGLAPPYFCSYICPSGTLMAGLPILGTNPGLRGQVGALFILKMSILLIVIVGAIFISRIFCKTLCPLGAFYSFFNKHSFYQMEYKDSLCIDCEKCVDVCPMAVDIRNNTKDLECIRCLECKNICPTKAIDSGFTIKEHQKKEIRTKDKSKI